MQEEWICQACGCENSAESPHCERCGKPAVTEEDYHWVCQACGHANDPKHTHCIVCQCPEVATGKEIVDYHRAFPVDPTPVENTGVKTFFSTSTQKLVIMSLVSFGLYEVYWFYKNWQLIKRHYPGCKVMPAARSIFAPIWAYSCFKEIRKSAADIEGYKNLPIGNLALAFFVLNFCSALPNALFLLGALTFLPLLPMNNAALAVNLRTDPKFKNNDQFSPLNRFWVVVGSLMWIMALLGYARQINNLAAG